MDFQISSPTGDRQISIALPQSGRIGILTSGGIDSSVMLALILTARKAENPTLPIIALNVKRGFGTERFSKAMIERMEEHFEMEIPFQYVQHPIDTLHHECLTRPIVPLLDLGIISKVYSADTSNPPEFEHEQAPNRTRVQDQFKFPRWNLPFLHCDKSHIVGLMHQLNVGFIEELSHTCFAQDEYRCKVCFQCEERAWAYKTLSLTDTGLH